MKITKNQKRLFIILGLVLSYAIIDFVLNQDQYKSLYFTSDKTSSQSSNTLVRQKPKMEVYRNRNLNELTWKRDPFNSDLQIILRKKQKKQNKDKALLLKAITYSGNNSLVIINDRILRVGDMIGDYKVQKIYKDKVKLTKFGRIIVLRPN